MDISQLPTTNTKKQLDYKHFPTKFQAVIFRNFNIVPIKNLANVLECSEEDILVSAAEMGLKYDNSLEKLWMEKGFLTILQYNWQLLNYEQLLTLLEWTPMKLEFVLREEDFAWVKLGNDKPICEEVKYHELTKSEKIATEKIKEIVEKSYLKIDKVPYEKAFSFLNMQPPKGEIVFPDDKHLRLLYSYSAPCGDPLLDETLDPYPDNMLEAYAKQGVNAVWFQGLLYSLVPYLGDLDISAGWEKRLENLKTLIKRAGKYGIKIYLYLNEPRAIPTRYFNEFPEFGGSIVESSNLQAFCPNNNKVLDLLSKGIERLCTEVPEIGGFFAITMSENLTHCLARPDDKKSHECPRCVDKSPAENITKVLNAIYQGITNSPSNAQLTAWNWAWKDEWAFDILENLNPNINIMCVSETALETDSYGVKGSIIDYSISKVGPGKLATKMWELAKKSNHKCIAKIQMNCTWEMSAVPYVPVMQLVKKHLDNLKQIDVNDYMLGWTLGGYPGGNLELLELSVEELCAKRFGKNIASQISSACEQFSKGFEFFPFNETSLIYTGPQNIGAANLLYLEKTNFEATMVKGFPYDDIDAWRGNHYPVDNLQRAFTDICNYWQKGLDILETLESEVQDEFKDNFLDLKLISESVFCHFASSLNQIKFIIARDKKDNIEMLNIIDKETAITERQWEGMHQDSRIGFEAANHYYYTENTFLEKLISCEYIKTLLQ